jgi:hypothetical protein
MKKQINASILLMVFVCGCSSTRLMNDGSKSDHCAEINRMAKGKTGRIALMDGNRISAKDISVTHDSVYWPCAGKAPICAVPTADIREISFTNRAGGTIRGFLFGIPSGFALAAVRIRIDPDSYRETSKLWYACNLGVMGGAVGMIYGSIFGKKEKFVFTGQTGESDQKKYQK